VASKLALALDLHVLVHVDLHVLLDRSRYLHVLHVARYGTCASRT